MKADRAKAEKEQKTKAINYEPLLPAVLDEMIKYIECVEEKIDEDWGCRDIKTLIKDDRMPEIYFKLLALKNGR